MTQKCTSPTHKESLTVAHLLPSPSGRRAEDEGAQPDFSGDPARELSIHGVEKTDEAGRLCRLNLAVHGLEGEIKHGGTLRSFSLTNQTS